LDKSDKKLKRRRFKMKKKLTNIVAASAILLAASGCSAKSNSSVPELSAAEVRMFLEKHINGKGFRNNTKVTEVLGVHQNVNSARIYFKWDGTEQTYGKPVEGEIGTASCLLFNSGEWFCSVDTNRAKYQGFLAE
jgi:hypothetical protein